MSRQRDTGTRGHRKEERCGASIDRAMRPPIQTAPGDEYEFERGGASVSIALWRPALHAAPGDDFRQVCAAAQVSSRPRNQQPRADDQQHASRA